MRDYRNGYNLLHLAAGKVMFLGRVQYSLSLQHTPCVSLLCRSCFFHPREESCGMTGTASTCCTWRQAEWQHWTLASCQALTWRSPGKILP